MRKLDFPSASVKTVRPPVNGGRVMFAYSKQKWPNNRQLSIRTGGNFPLEYAS